MPAPQGWRANRESEVGARWAWVAPRRVRPLCRRDADSGCEVTQAERSERRYKVRRSNGEVQYVTRQELWRLQEQRAERIRRQRRRQRLTVITSAAVGLVLIAAGVAWWWWGRPGTGPAGAPGQPPRAAVAGLPAPLPQVSERAADAAAAGGESTEAPPPASERVRAAVERWASAWSSQDVAAYLRCYSERFRPADGQPRPAWERQRRERLTRPETIEVEILEPRVELLEPGVAEVRFRQAYRSPDYSDLVAKTLRLVEEDGSWRILSELSEPLSG